jgi:hypothetical protein
MNIGLVVHMDSKGETSAILRGHVPHLMLTHSHEDRQKGHLLILSRDFIQLCVFCVFILHDGPRKVEQDVDFL